MKLVPVILSGGSGARLWPLSREQYPKQFLSLTTDNTMLQETIMRLEGLHGLTDPIIVCNTDHRFLVAEQCQKIGINNPTILLEPIGRNTAPAIAAAALQSIKQGNNGVLLVLSADHLIQDVDKFHKAIDIAITKAHQNKLITFGIMPTNANTGYGYIKLSSDNADGSYEVEEFVEKPDFLNAQSYLKQGNYLWNSGIFVFKAKSFINELTIYAPDIIKSVNEAINSAEHDLDFVRLNKQSFESSPSDSIDYALMEKSENVVVIPLDVKWHDIGNWSALYDIGTKDNNGNVIQGDVFIEDTTNTYINANHHMVATIGVQDLIIVDTPNATLISTQDKTQDVKRIVEQLQNKNRKERLNHLKVYRPWGWYESIEVSVHFQVKRLHVNSGSKLSLQMHYKRAEHWVVVSGIASVINGKESLTLREGESTYIPIGTKHSLENKTNEILEIIEVQSGVYLGEDDIVRFEDIYGRVKD